jgi:hypothetical protein
MINYKFEEERLLKELTDYIDATYKGHYSKDGKIQTTDFIMSQFEDGSDFLRGNAIKYLARYGLKEGKNKKDLFKTIHYCLLLMYYDKNNFTTFEDK